MNQNESPLLARTPSSGGEAMANAPAEVIAAYKRLSPRMRAFALALPTAKSQEAAALQAGYAPKTAQKQAWMYAAHPDVKVVTDHLVGSAIKTAEITLERCMQELAKLAFGDPGALFDENGALMPPEKWPKESRAIVAEVHQVDLHDSEGGKIGQVNKVKFADKHASLRTALQLIDAFPDKKKQVTHTHRVGVVVVPQKVRSQNSDDAVLAGQARRLEQPAKKGNAPDFMLRRVRELG